MQCVCVMFSSVVCPVLQCFYTLSRKRHNFRKKKLPDIKCVLIFSATWFETFRILRRSERDAIRNICIGLYVSYPLFLSDFDEK
jgi:hypothetical protein